MEQTEVIVTLYEGHYHYGVAALLNSLIKSGFRGLFRIGYRGTIPIWANKLVKVKDNEFSVDEIIILFVYIDTNSHFGYYKPFFMRDTLQDFPSAKSIYYFDPDIVVIAPWGFYKAWIQSGVALCMDNCFGFVHRTHPWRAEWARLAGMSTDLKTEIDYYVNSGFVGLQRSEAGILDKWIHLTEEYRKRGGDLTLFEKAGDRAFKGDQDLLNAVISTSHNLRISLIGKEGMGFSQPAYLMSHAVNNIKPWKNFFLKNLFKKGFAPSLAEKNYFKHANSLIAPYAKNIFLVKSIDIKLASFLSRVLANN